MAEINPNDLPPELEELAKELPEDVDMEALLQNITRMAMQFVHDQGTKPIQTQLLLLFGFLLIPLSLILYCFCKIVNNHKKRQGKDKKKQKDQKKENKKETKKDSKKKA